MRTATSNCLTEHIFQPQKRRLPSPLRRLLVFTITLESAAFALSQALAQPQDYFQTQGKPCISASGEDRYPQVNFGFDYITLPPVVSPGQQVSVSVQYSFLNPSVPADVYYLNVFGDWQPATPLASLASGRLVGGTQTVSNSFTFQAPGTPGNYRIRVPITLAFAPVTNFYGGPANGPDSPGTGPCYTEVCFAVKAPPVQDYFVSSNRAFVSAFGESRASDNNLGFDYIELPPVVSPGEQVEVGLQWSFLNPSAPGDVIYMNAFGDWQPATELARLINGAVLGGSQTNASTFTFQAPSSPGNYRIRIPFVEAYSTVTNFYGGPSEGPYSVGTGPCYTEVCFTVKAPPVQDYFVTSNRAFVSAFGESRASDNNLGFDYIALPPVVSPGGQVEVGLQWSFVNPSAPGDVIYMNAFGDWQPATELARLINGAVLGGSQTNASTFTFQAPSTPGNYRIRIPFVEAYSTVTNFYGGPSEGPYSVGTGPCCAEVTFRVANVWQYNFQSFAGLALYGPPGNYRIDANSDLATTNWITLTNFSLSTTPGFWADLDSPKYQQRFYRAVPIP